MVISPQREGFAAEISGLDLRASIAPADARALRRALLDFAVLIFRMQPLSDAEQLAFMGVFGRASKCSNITNVGVDDRIVDADSMDARYARGNQLWHMDSTFVAVPPNLASLVARELPTAGGATQFADLRAAWDSLPGELAKRIESLSVEHNLAALRRRIEEPAVTAVDPPSYRQGATHPLVMTLPETGRRNLFLSAHAACVSGWTPIASEELFERLVSLATAPRFVYTHEWSVGDVLVWDNRCVLHRVLPYDDQRERRTLARVEVVAS